VNAAIVDTDVVSMFFKGDTSALYYQVPLITNNRNGYSAVDF